MQNSNIRLAFILPLVLPLAILGVLYGGGLYQTLLQSFGTDFLFTKQPTIEHYRAVLTAADFQDSLLYSLRISIWSSLAAAFTGAIMLYILYLLMSYDKKPYTGYMRFIQSPLLIPYLISAFFIFLLFSQTGIISRVVHALGLIRQSSQFPVLTNDRTGLGIVLAYTWKAAPFVVLMGHPVLLRIDSNWKDAALLLGAGQGTFFKEIVIPALVPSILSSWFIIFGFSFASFEVPYLLGVTYPKALPVLCYEIFSNRSFAERPQAMALAIIITLIASSVGLLAFSLYKKSGKSNAFRW